MTRTRLCWQRKKNNKPRPIKMGEFLRSSYAKRTVHAHRVRLRTTFLNMRQWGIGLPGSAEALSHWRGNIEHLIQDGSLEPMVAADLDLVNMFGNVEWPAIRDAVQLHFAEAGAWTFWQHQRPSTTTLPSGVEVATDRGAEQGDVFGSIQSALALGEARGKHFATTPGNATYPGACDQWYIDDGQVFCQPQLFDQWLRALDLAIATFGATRGTITDDNIKSSCRLLCPRSRRHEFTGWDTEYVRATTKVLDSDAAATALGAMFGPLSATQEAAAECVKRTNTLREAICGIGHAATELILTRQCADVSKLIYHMRVNGDRLDASILSTFDGGLRVAVESTLGGEMPDMSWWQATCGVKHAGLGLRTTQSTALAAFVASRIASRPLVRTMVEQYAAATGASADNIMVAYDRRSEDALVTLVSSLPPESGGKLIEELDVHASECALAWTAIIEGEEDPADVSGQASAARARPGASITPRDGEGDVEHPTGAQHGRGQRIQHVITSYCDEGLREGLRQHYATAGDGVAIRRLDELTDPDVDHSWLWHVSKHHGPVLADDEFVEAVRVRLGAAGPTEPVPCARCGRVLLDSAGSHAACCDSAESTRGHYSVEGLVLRATLQCDPSAESEVGGLIPGTALRPADVLTTALGHVTTALDIGICSPDAQNAGRDCVDTMFQRKVAYYGPHLAALERQNIEYLPLIWSSYGRPHARTVSVLRTLSNRIARRRGTACSGEVFRHLSASISVEIQRRVARQVMSCWPGDSRWCPDGDGA